MPDTEDIYFYERSCELIRWLGRVWHFGVLLPLAGLGAVVTWRRRRDLGVLYVSSSGVLAAVVLFYVLARYRYPLVPVLVLFAAAGLVAVTDRRALSQRPPLRWLGSVVLPLALVANWPVNTRDSHFATSYNNVGVALSQRGDYAAALAAFDAAARAAPGYLTAEISRGATLVKMGRHADAQAVFEHAMAKTLLLRGNVPEARQSFERVLARWPEDPEALNGAGHALLCDGDDRGALDHMRRAAGLEPDDPRLALDLAVLLCAMPDANLRDGREALEIADRIVRHAPRPDAEMLDALGMALAECGRFAEARDVAQRAIATAEAAGQSQLAALARLRAQQYEKGEQLRFPSHEPLCNQPLGASHR